MSDELTLGGNTPSEAIDFAMNNYQRSKTAAANAEDAATEADHHNLRERELDMAYWHARLIAAGAFSLELAATPENFAHDYDKELYAHKMKTARALVWAMEQDGLPFVKPQ